MPKIVNTTALGSDSLEEKADNRDTMISIEDVTMTFNMASEQLNSLKEYAIKIAKRELFFEGFTALDNVSLEVKRGDVFGIVGTNGSGKSTLLKIVAGVLEPSKGKVTINGNIAPLIELGAGFDIELTARENIFLNGALLGYSKAFITEHFDEIVSFAEIEQFLDIPIKNYSSGMIARIAFAIATVIVPDILIVDEVLSVGDFMFQRKCEDRIKQLIEQHGVTVLIVSHSTDQIERLCNRVVWIEKGHKRMIGPAEEVCHMYRALGGRTGSKESELRIYNALTGIDKRAAQCELIEFKGEDFFKTSELALTSEMKDDSFEAVVLASSETHANTVIASGFAGILGAPIIPIRHGSIPDETAAIIQSAKPSKVYIADRLEETSEVVSELAELAPEAEVMSLGKRNLFEFCLEVMGIEDSSKWGKTAALVDFNQNPESFCFVPYAYNNHCPVFMTENYEADASLLIKALRSLAIEQVVALGEIANRPISRSVGDSGITVIPLVGETAFDSCLEVCKYIDGSDGFSSESLCVAPLPLGQWPELLSTGFVAARNNCPVILEDPTNLNSISTCMDYVRDSGTKRLFIFGGTEGLNELDRALLSHPGE